MERQEERFEDELIDLGAASVQTQGIFPRYPELGVGSEIKPPGLAQD